MADFKFAQSQPMYDPEGVRPMREELTAVGIKELLTPEDVDQAFGQSGTLLLVVNSVCGCAAGNARPGVMIALQNKVIPDHLTTVFAGQDRAATDHARSKMSQVMPSSPCIALFKDGSPVFVLERHHIEDRTANQVCEELLKAFTEHCTTEGPSIPPEELAKIPLIQACGSSIPLFKSS